LAISKKYTHQQLFVLYVTDFDIMADIMAEQVGAPLEGVNFLLNAVGFNIAEQRACIMEAGLADYEDFCHLAEKDI
jgi:hypothetical protein